MTAIQNAAVTFRSKRFTFNTATTLREEMDKLRRAGADIAEALKGFRVAYIKDGELGVDNHDHCTIGILDVDGDGNLDYITELGDGQCGNIDTNGRVHDRNSCHRTYPSGSDLYIEASYFTPKPRLGRTKVITLAQAQDAGMSLTQIANEYYVGVAKPNSTKTLALEGRGPSEREKVAMEGNFYNAHVQGTNLCIGGWYIARANGLTHISIDTEGGPSDVDWTIVLMPRSGDINYSTHMPLSEMTLEDVCKFLKAVGAMTDIQFYLGTKVDNLVVKPLSYDCDAPGNNFKNRGDWYGDIVTKGAITLALHDESTLKNFGRGIWIDADTVNRYAPAYYHGVTGGDFAEGELIATPDARILRVVEVTEKFIITQHPAGHGETIALPITKGVEYKRVNEEVARAIL